MKNGLIKYGTTNDDGKKLDGHKSNEDYLTCNKVWNEFNLKNMGDYHDQYLEKDVLLLADVFEKFIDACLKFYKVDPCHYFSSPALSLDAMLKMTGAKLGKIVDIDMCLFIEKGLRGGISYIAKRYIEENNKYMKDYNRTKPSKFITYLDLNNLYRWAMSRYLPYGRFKLLKNADHFDENSISEKSSIGNILEKIEVNLEHLDELHALHNDYPLAPEKLAISYDMLSDCPKQTADKYGIKLVM